MRSTGTMAHGLTAEDIDWHRVVSGDTYWLDLGRGDISFEFVISDAQVARAIAAKAFDLARQMEENQEHG